MPYFADFGALALAGCAAVALISRVGQARSADAGAARAESPEDAATAAWVLQALQAEPHQFYRHITVTVRDGVVRLGGFADSRDAISRAREIARTARGVLLVEDQIQL